eukprot:s2083_g13.t1
MLRWDMTGFPVERCWQDCARSFADKQSFKLFRVLTQLCKLQRVSVTPTEGRFVLRLCVMYQQSSLLLDEPATRANLIALETAAPDNFTRKCKLICTMGPACWDPPMLMKLIETWQILALMPVKDQGMNIARLNFSHGDHEGHGRTVENVREACKQRPDKPVAILLDTKGPEIRTGFFKDGLAGGKINLKDGQELKLVTDYSFKGDETTLAVSYQQLPTAVKPGSIILAADGSLSLKVKSCGSDHVVTEVMNDIAMGEKKNMNLPGVKEKDKKDLLEFGIPQAIDFVAASFVQDAEDIKLIRKTLGEGINNIDQIIDATDGVMVARGDMGMEIDIEKVGLVQKMIISKCNIKGKFVVTATQMLDSMERAPRPTLLNGRTVQSLYLGIRMKTLDLNIMSPVESVCSSAVKTVIDSDCKLIIALTETGHTARIISKYRPPCPILELWQHRSHYSQRANIATDVGKSRSRANSHSIVSGHRFRDRQSLGESQGNQHGAAWRQCRSTTRPKGRVSRPHEPVENCGCSVKKELRAPETLCLLAIVSYISYTCPGVVRHSFADEGKPRFVRRQRSRIHHLVAPHSTLHQDGCAVLDKQADDTAALFSIYRLVPDRLAFAKVVQMSVGVTTQWYEVRSKG